MNLPKAWVDAPIITALSDAPIDNNLGQNDKFRLTRSMGPVLDILRHYKTQTPLSVAIYGTWGSGKSTAMHWLREGLEAWNQHVDDNNIQITDKNKTWPHVLSVNFYPWKYTCKEDVWRGLIVEIILACIKHREKDSKTVGEVVSKFSGFLGSKLITALSALKLKGSLYGVDGTIDVKQLVKVFENEDINPETAYLNEFETTLEEWVKDIITPTTNEGETERHYRLVVFIDDLDRCMPDVALQVLEALKLYLNIPGLIFVLGLDKTVVEQLVTKHYRELGVAEDKSKHYLAKMFQVEVDLEPQDSLVGEYVKNLISDEEWENLGIKKDSQTKKVFLSAIQELGEHSPRETKRLVNSTLMLARGAQMVMQDGYHTDTELTAQEAIQVHLIEEVLRRCHPQETHNWMRRLHGQEFFTDWAQEEKRQNLEISERDNLFSNLYKDPLLQTLVEMDSFPSLGKLQALPKKTPIAETRLTLQGEIERQARMSWEEITDNDFKAIKTLRFFWCSYEDWSLLSKCKHLQRLLLIHTNFSDIAQLQHLNSLKDLSIYDSDITTGEPLLHLSALKKLDLRLTQITDYGFIDDMTNLTMLILSDHKSLDLAKLKNLQLLEHLSLNKSERENLNGLTALKGLKKLSSLFLHRAHVKNYDALAELKNLQTLSLMGSNIQNLSPLFKCKKLKELTLPSKFEGKDQTIELKKALPDLFLKTTSTLE